MDMELIERKFGLMGARVKLGTQAQPSRRDARFTMDVRSDRKGEYFDIRMLDNQPVELSVLDVRPEMRHLLLMSPSGKFLCGHDERHWFVAAVPGSNASNVKTALVALKPPAVRREEARKRIRTKDRFRRRNKQYHKLIGTNPGARNWGWRVMRRGMEVYARGRVWHADHKTIYLDCWHRVFMNTENEAPAMRNLVFLD